MCSFIWSDLCQISPGDGIYTLCIRQYSCMTCSIDMAKGCSSCFMGHT